MKKIAIALALGDIYAQGGVGELKQPLDGACARFAAVTRGMTCDNDSLVICTAGYSDTNPTVPHDSRRLSLAGQLERYVRETGNTYFLRLTAKPLCWSTRNEVRLGIKIAQRRSFANKEEKDVQVVIASNLTHLFRIWLYLLLYTPKNWKIKLVWAHHHFSLMSHLLEPIKVIRDLVYIVRVLHRLFIYKLLKRV